MKQLPFILLFIFFGIKLELLAQDAETVPEFITDRPDATESPNTVPGGSFQIETGGFYTSFEENIEGNTVQREVLGYNTTLIRYGILDNLEFRLGWNFEEVQTTINGAKLQDVTSGFSPLLAGVKVTIAKENGWLPTIGLLGHLYLPFTAADDYKPQTTGADFRFSLDHSLSEKSGLAYNIGAQWGDDSPEVAYVYTLVYGYSITNNFSLYAEVYGDLPENSSGNHFWDAGLTYVLTPSLQLDATVGSSITDGQDLLLAAGVSYRILKKQL